MCVCELPMRCSCALAWNFGPVTFDLGDMTLTICVSDGDGSTPCRALADLVSFVVHFEVVTLIFKVTEVTKVKFGFRSITQKVLKLLTCNLVFRHLSEVRQDVHSFWGRWGQFWGQGVNFWGHCGITQNLLELSSSLSLLR